jgi:hypothetical protein
LKRYASDARVRLVCHGENGSISRRLNEGVDLSRGEFVSFLYSDDYYLPNKLAHQVALFAKAGDGYGVVYSSPLRHNQFTGKTWRQTCLHASGYVLKYMLADGLREGTIDMLSPMLRRRCFEKYRFYDDLFAEGESYYYRVAMTERFLYDDEPGVVLREHDKNLGKATKFNIDTYAVICRRLSEAPDFAPELRRHLRSFEAELLRNGGWSVLRVDGDVAWARKAIRRSLLLEPTGIFKPRALGALALLLLPPAIRVRANALGHRLSGQPGNVINVEIDRPI